MRRKQFPSFLEKMSASNKGALISSEIPDGITPYFISLSDNAVGQALSFATTAILAFQYDKYGQLLNENNDPELTSQLAIAEIELQEIAYQLMTARRANMDGSAITGATLSAVFLTGQQARTLGYPVKDETKDDDPYLRLTIPPGPAGPAGADGADGANGADGADGAIGPAGPAGPAGADGVCTDCGPGGQPDGGGGGPPGGDGGGSGDNGEPNPDGGDKIVYIGGCPDPILNFPFCSDSFSFANADMRGAILSAVTGTGNFNSATEELISVVLDWHGAAYAGVAELTVGGQFDYTGPHSNLARVLKITDAESNELIVPHTVEQFGLEGTLVVAGYHYNGTTGLRWKPENNPIPLNGQMSGYPILGGANCHVPPDETDPAWLKCCLRQFVKRAKPGSCPALDADGSFFKVPFAGPITLPSNAGIRFENFGDYVSSFPAFRTSNQNFNINGAYGFKPLHTYRMHFNCHTNIDFDANWAIKDADFNTISDGTFSAVGNPDFHNVGDGGDNFQTVQFSDIITPSNIEECTLYRIYIFYGRGDKFWNIQDIQDLGPIS
jgi:hypothetical protein